MLEIEEAAFRQTRISPCLLVLLRRCFLVDSPLRRRAIGCAHCLSRAESRYLTLVYLKLEAFRAQNHSQEPRNAMEPEGLKVGTLLIGLEGRCLHRSTTLAYCYRANITCFEIKTKCLSTVHPCPSASLCMFVCSFFPCFLVRSNGDILIICACSLTLVLLCLFVVNSSQSVRLDEITYTGVSILLFKSLFHLTINLGSSRSCKSILSVDLN